MANATAEKTVTGTKFEIASDNALIATRADGSRYRHSATAMKLIWENYKNFPPQLIPVSLTFWKENQ